MATHFSNSGSIDTAVEKIKRHPKYYLPGGDVHFLVESYLFRVHKYFFERESAYFREKLATPAAPGQTPKGSTDANPYPLDGVAHHDFSRFLWIFYNPKYSIYDAGADDWIAILRLACDWRFPEVKRFAVRELERFTIDALNKIDLYQRFEVDKQLLIPSYIALIVRPEPLSIPEARQISLETSMLIATARECARGKIENGARSPGPVSTKEEETVSLIKSLFGINSNGPATPSLTPIEDVVPSSVMSPSQPSKFDPSLTVPKPAISPYTALGSASATVTMLNTTPASSDVFGLTGTLSANGTSPNGASPAGAGPISRNSSRVVTAAEANATAAAIAAATGKVTGDAGAGGEPNGGAAGAKSEPVKGPGGAPADAEKDKGADGKGAGGAKLAGNGDARPATPTTGKPLGDDGGAETGDEGRKNKGGGNNKRGGRGGRP